MVYTNLLTATQKDKKIKIIIKRDGDVCFYCTMPFVFEVFNLRRTIDHANDKPSDNRVENLLLSHAVCNERKKNDFDWKTLALDKLRENETNAEPLGEREKNTDADEIKEGDINLIVNKLVFYELETVFSQKDDSLTISYTKILQRIHYLLIKQTHGRGSEQAVRRSIDAYCSDYAPWISEKQGKGNRVIRKRKPNEKV